MKNYRKTPRAFFIDYDAGLFFITICTHNMKPYFGNIYEKQMYLSRIGEIVKNELSNPQLHHPLIEVPIFVVMPNHIHAIVQVKVGTCRGMSDLRNEASILQRSPNPTFRGNADVPRHVPTLSNYVSLMKGSVTRRVRNFLPEFAWQSRFHDHLIRSIEEGNRISKYIETNVENWHNDCFYL